MKRIFRLEISLYDNDYRLRTKKFKLLATFRYLMVADTPENAIKEFEMSMCCDSSCYRVIDYLGELKNEFAEEAYTEGSDASAADK